MVVSGGGDLYWTKGIDIGVGLILFVIFLIFEFKDLYGNNSDFYIDLVCACTNSRIGDNTDIYLMA